MKKRALLVLPALLVTAGVAWTYLPLGPSLESGVRDLASANYESFDACRKQEVLWSRVQESEYRELPPMRQFGAVQILAMGRQEIAIKGRRQSDFAPAGWQKYIHAKGALAKVRIVPRGGRFTGIFQGADCALLRLSLTYAPDGSRPVAPGLALKVLRNGIPSVNVSALVSLDGQEKNFNFFAHPMSNIVPPSDGFGQRMMHRIFAKVTRYPEELLASEMARVDTAGQRVTSPVAPRQLFFVPGESLRFPSTPHDVRRDFLSIPAGTVIYKIHAVANRENLDYRNYTAADKATFLRESDHIADIITTSEFKSSQFGDDGLFFRHQLRP